MSLLDRMERRFGKHAITNLMYYIIICQVAGLVIQTIAPGFLDKYLSLNMYAIIQGKQIWRLITFVLVPGGYSLSGVNIIFTALTLYFMYYFGRSLENAWGTVRFNMFYLSGILLNILAALVIYFLYDLGLGYNAGIYSYAFGRMGINYINTTLIILCSFVFSDAQVLFNFIIPIKMKYLGILYAVEIVIEMVRAIGVGAVWQGIAIFVALLNFVIFFLAFKRQRGFSAKHTKRKIKYKDQVRNATTSGPRHRCAVCGRTELDDENLEFRFCSRCDGNYEYCMEHLFTHEHVKRH
ncbi:MAG: rhomboid family intramembrane serine protease [bacterium]|nr:rhomboid family intramembrane serine protease [bacterium]